MVETDTLARIGRDTPLYLRRAEADGGPLRQTLEAFIRQRFADEHQARIHHFLPCLLGLLDEHGVVQGGLAHVFSGNQHRGIDEYGVHATPLLCVSLGPAARLPPTLRAVVLGASLAFHVRSSVRHAK